VRDGDIMELTYSPSIVFIQLEASSLARSLELYLALFHVQSILCNMSAVKFRDFQRRIPK